MYPQHTDAPIHIIRSQWILNHGWFPFDEYAFDQKKSYVYPPAFHVLGAVSKKLTGSYLAAPAASGAFSIVLTYRLVSLWYNRTLGLSTALVLALNPFFVLWSARMYVGTTITAGFLLTMVLYFTYLERDDRRYLYAAFITGGGLSAVKTYGPLAAGIILFHLLWIRRDSLTETLRTTATPLAAGVLASLPWPIRNILLTGSPVPKVTGRDVVGNTQPPVNGIHVLVPTWKELQLFFPRALGIQPPQAVTDQLGSLHSLLPILWLALPLLIVFVMVYGVRTNRLNVAARIWFATFVLLYFVQRVASGGGTALKYRHFVTLTPIFCLTLVMGYRSLPVNVNLKRVAGVLIVLTLLTQMGAVAAVQTTYMQTTWEPATEWVDENIEHDEVIYMSRDDRGMAYRVDPQYKFITISSKEGYIHPSENFTEVVSDRADWVISNDDADPRAQARIDNALASGTLRHAETIEVTKKIKFGGTTVTTLDRTWYFYKVVNSTNKKEQHSSETIRV
ncbi:ArnT family glycosyltransferase [Halomicroarcula sp. GCM10025894]|uniref:ArnT family glycosyltransferase n=1 Tax=Halomicroarcula sp. GCM10025894 TaxID=3252673 RepID=UPI00361ABF8E